MGKSTFSGPVQSKTFFDQGYMSYGSDFIGAGAQAIPAAGSAENGCDWVKKIVGAAPPTVAAVANAANGVIANTLTSASQKQDAALYWDDKKAVDISKAGWYKTRIQLSVIPTGTAQIFAGLFSNWADGPDAMTYGIFFEFTGNGTILLNCDDNATDTQVATGITLVATDWATLEIDFTNVFDIRFYVSLNGAPRGRVGDSTTFNFAATGANAVLQPFSSAYKASGTDVATLYTDFIKVWNRRIVYP